MEITTYRSMLLTIAGCYTKFRIREKRSIKEDVSVVINCFIEQNRYLDEVKRLTAASFVSKATYNSI